MTNEQKQRLQQKASSAMESKNIAELTQGYLRYEALRKLNLRQLRELHSRNFLGENFDGMADELVVSD